MGDGVVRDDGAIVFEEFEEGDPRRGPHSLSVQNEAEAWARAPGRWHRVKRHVDWFAIRLAVGRGYASPQAGRMFGVEDSNIRKRAGEEKWVSPMAECDRRELSVWVWLAGWRRLDPGDAESRGALKKSSEWRLKQEQEHAVWQEKNRLGEPMKFTINDEIPDDAYFSGADPKRDERRAVVDKLEARLRELDAQLEAEEEEGDDGAEEDADASDRAREAPAGMGEISGRVDSSGDGGSRVASICPSEPASS